MTPIIETKHLTKSYGKARGIIDLNLTVNEGEIFGFIGPNGAGKSTTIRTLLGLITPTSGTAQIFGKDVLEEHTSILEQIGYMPSEAMFYRGMRVEDIIKLSAEMRKKDCKEEAQSLCERLKLDTKKKVEELSLGNRKKVSIVCAMQHNPKLFILDEPTSGLDPLMQKEFFTLLHEYHEKGSTLFLSSHVLSEIQHHCTKAAIIREGKLIVSDSVEALSSTNARRVSIKGVADIPQLPGMKEYSTAKDSVEFLYQGDMNQLLKVLADKHIKDITITEPDLEEIFMHYYTDGGNK